MDRLTVHGATSQRDINRLMEYSNENQFGRNQAYYRLQEYEDLDTSGKLIKLPCAIGDTVYGSFQCYGGEKIHECKVVAIKAYKNNDDPECYYFVHVKFDIIDPFYNDGRVTTYGGRAVIGKNFGSWNRVFFTLAEAEAALKERESE